MERSFVTVPAVQASLAWATALHAGAQAFEVAALSAKYGAQTLAAAAELLVDVDTRDAPAPAGPPVAQWDELTLGSIRAQLRRWDVDTLRALHAYELEHGNRPGVVSMLTNRISKTSPAQD